MGLVSAPLYPACAAAVGEWVPAGRRSRCNGLVTGPALVGVALTPAAFGALIDRVDWPAAFLLASWRRRPWPWSGRAARPRPRSPLAARAPVGPGQADSRPAGTVWERILEERSLVLLTLSYAAVGYFQYLFFYWMTYYFERVLHAPRDDQPRLRGGPAAGDGGRACPWGAG